MRGRGGSLASNPVLIGAVTVLVILVAVFLAYNANNGLPFIPTYDLKAEVPNGANLVVGNEVRIGGARVGTVSDVGVKRAPGGKNIALLSFKLDKAIQPLPEDSTLIVRPKSLLGQKYVQVELGKSDKGFKAGTTIPIKQATPSQVEFDELIDTFDEPTREGLARTTTGFGTALAGRGESINMLIGQLKPLLSDVIPVARYLRSSQTGLVPAIQGLSRTAAAVAPVAQQQAELFVNLERTFGALAEVSRPYLQETIEETPATLEQGIRTLRRQRPFLENTTALVRDLRPGVRALGQAAPDLSDALRVGTPTLRRLPQLNRRLVRVLQSLGDFAQDPVVPRGVEDLTATVRDLRPTLDFIAPAQLQCNYIGNLFENGSDILSTGDDSGNTQRFIIVASPQGPNSEGQNLSNGPANGPTTENHLHANPYPNTAAPGQPKECEAGNEPYVSGQTTIGNTAGTQQAFTDGNP